MIKIAVCDDEKIIRSYLTSLIRVLYTKDGEQASLCRLEYYAKIGDLEKELQGYFCRIHKGFLVNLAYVDEYSRTEIMLVNGDKLPLSKYKYILEM